MNPSENDFAPPSKFEISPHQNQIFLKLIELGFDPELCLILLKIYPNEMTFTDFLNRFLSDENGTFKHVFIPGCKETPHLCQICHTLQSRHEKFSYEEEEKVSSIFKTESDNSEEKKCERSSLIKSLVERSLIRYQCKICFETLPDLYMFKINDLNHEICIDCLKSYIGSEILNGRMFPLKCPHCEIKILNLSMIKRYVDGTTFLKYQRLMLNFALNTQKDLLYCPGCYKVISKSECRVEKYIDEKEKKQVKTWVCPNVGCEARICIKCYREEHFPTSCETISVRELKEFNFTTDVQRCPNCKAYVEKHKGCNHMVCVCSYEFCWLCNGQFTTQHYNSDFLDAKMICPFKRKPLDMKKLDADGTPSKVVNLSTTTNLIVNSANCEEDHIDEEKIIQKEKKATTKKIKYCLVICLLSPILFFFCPPYLFCQDFTMSNFWIKNLKNCNCLLKGSIIFILFLFGLAFCLPLWLYVFYKFCKPIDFRDPESRSPMLSPYSRENP